jgi:2-polyprenyl-6-methoxyphenol hydroxylase-like FAD-dependent oxidoreductase
MPAPRATNRTVLALAAAGLVLAALPAAAQNCKRAGADVTCDDGRVGIFTGDAIVWADGTHSRAASQSPSVIIGNKPSVHVGPGVFVGTKKGGMAPLEDPSKKRCAVLDGVSYCN